MYVRLLFTTLPPPSQPICLKIMILNFGRTHKTLKISRLSWVTILECKFYRITPPPVAKAREGGILWGGKNKKTEIKMQINNFLILFTRICPLPSYANITLKNTNIRNTLGCITQGGKWLSKEGEVIFLKKWTPWKPSSDNLLTVVKLLYSLPVWNKLEKTGIRAFIRRSP